MTLSARENVPALAGLLTVVSLALVFAAVLRIIPASAFPRASDAFLGLIPHLNAAISVTAIAVITTSWRWIRRDEVARHRVGMLTGMLLFVAFLVLYLYKVIVEGPASFAGPNAIYLFVYLPVLAIHMLLAIVSIPLLYYVLLLGLTRTVPEIRRTKHRRVGRVAASFWLTSFVLGITVYALLYVVY